MLRDVFGAFVACFELMQPSDSAFAVLPLQEASSSAPIFGSASTFGSGSGFAGFTGVDTNKSKAAASTSAENEDDQAANDEECAAEYTPVVQLQEVETSTGEETETALFDV